MDLDVLRSVPLFASPDAYAPEKVSTFLTVRGTSPATAGFRVHDPSDATYVIDRGKVRITICDADGHSVRLAELRAGDLFGGMALLDGQGRSADAAVIKGTRLARLRRAELLAFIRRDPGATLEMPTALASRRRVNLDYQLNLKNELILSDIIYQLDERKRKSRA